MAPKIGHLARRMGREFSEYLEALGAWLHAHRKGIARGAALAVVIVALPLAAFALLPTFLGMLAPPLDSSKDLYSVNRPLAFTFLDAQGGEVGHRGAIIGERLRLDQMPAYLPAAFIAMEDRRFYEHHGIDVRGLARALWTNFRKGHVVAGGSTITQQTAKIVFTNQEHTFKRKWQELFETAQHKKTQTKTQNQEHKQNHNKQKTDTKEEDGAA